jgi:hypothetical protein
VIVIRNSCEELYYYRSVNTRDFVLDISQAYPVAKYLSLPKTDSLLSRVMCGMCTFVLQLHNARIINERHLFSSSVYLRNVLFGITEAVTIIVSRPDRLHCISPLK